MEDGGGMDLTKATSSGSAQESASTDSNIDDLLKGVTRSCTHTHTCNPPGPGSSVHTHTCYHTHTQLISSGGNETNNNDSSVAGSANPRKRPLGNREAVRKYREKKKAHAAYLEEEVRKLRVINQHLGRKLQLRAVLEAELLRLRSLLVDLNRRIDSELGFVPFQEQCSNNNNTNCTVGVFSFEEGRQSGADHSSITTAAGLFCETNVRCFHPVVAGSSSCQSLDRAADCKVSNQVSTGGGHDGDCSIIASEAFVPSMKPT